MLGHCLIEHALIELEPAELAIQVATFRGGIGNGRVDRDGDVTGV